MVAFHNDAAGSHVVETSSPEKLKGVLPRWSDCGEGRGWKIINNSYKIHYTTPSVDLFTDSITIFNSSHGNISI